MEARHRQHRATLHRLRLLCLLLRRRRARRCGGGLGAARLGAPDEAAARALATILARLGAAVEQPPLLQLLPLYGAVRGLGLGIGVQGEARTRE